LVHGIQSHGGWYLGLGERLAASGFDVLFPDRRGSGANAVERGDAPGAGRLIEDTAEYCRHIRDAHPGLPLALAGISWGGKVALATASRHGALVDFLVLICPGLVPKVGVSARERLAIGWALATKRKSSFAIPLSDPALFTASRQAQDFIANDPSALRQATARLLLASTRLDREVTAARARVTQPTLLMLAEHDRIIDNARTREYFGQMASKDRHLIEYSGAHHTLEFEPEPERYAHDLASWLCERTEPK
jgi:alpha-beta hydrolase superfamily lysophospholipase